MKHLNCWIPAFAGMTLLAGCGSIGEGSTVQSLRVLFSPAGSVDQGVVIDNDLPTRKVRLFDCFCSNLGVYGTFTDGTIANFSARAKWTSSDPSVVSVTNYGDAVDTACAAAQAGSGMLRPHGPGTAVISAEFLNKVSTITVEVADTSLAAGGTFAFAPFDTTNVDHAVPVGGIMPMILSVTLDGRPRTVNSNATYAINPASSSVVTIGSTGVVAGHSADGGVARTAQATFGSCSDVTVTSTVRVGEIVSPLLVAEEPAFAGNPDTPSRGKLALSNNEDIKVTANLDYNGDGTTDTTVPVDISSLSKADFTDPCTTRIYNADPSFAPSQCQVNASDTCGSSVTLCADVTATACPTTLTAKCRTVDAPMSTLFSNTIRARTASSAATTVFATFPSLRGVDTTLTAAVGASLAGLPDTVTVTGLLNYPTGFPWEAQVEGEVMQVIAGSGTTLSVIRGYAGTSPVAHASGALFSERSFSTLPNSVSLTATAGTLTNVAIDAAAAPVLYATLQLAATGTYTDTTTSAVTVKQPVTHVATLSSGTPTLIWSSNRAAVATVGNVGLGTPGLVTPSSPCGGKVVIRARATTSTNTDTGVYEVPVTRGDATDDGAHNTLANDAACATDLLCDQVILDIPRASPLPPGFTAEACDAL